MSVCAEAQEMTSTFGRQYNGTKGVRKGGSEMGRKPSVYLWDEAGVLEVLEGQRCNSWPDGGASDLLVSCPRTPSRAHPATMRMSLLYLYLKTKKIHAFLKQVRPTQLQSYTRIEVAMDPSSRYVLSGNGTVSQPRPRWDDDELWRFPHAPTAINARGPPVGWEMPRQRTPNMADTATVTMPANCRTELSPARRTRVA